MAKTAGVPYNAAINGGGNFLVKGDLQFMQDAVDNRTGSRLTGLYIDNIADSPAPLVMINVYKSFGALNAFFDAACALRFTVNDYNAAVACCEPGWNVFN